MELSRQSQQQTAINCRVGSSSSSASNSKGQRNERRRQTRESLRPFSVVLLATFFVVLVAQDWLVVLASKGQQTPESTDGRSSSEQQVTINNNNNNNDHRLALPSTQAVPQNQQPSAEASIANAKVQNSAQDMQLAAGHHYGGKGHGGKFYMYAESPKKGAYKAGFARGNHKHMIMRKEYQHKSHAGGYMKWYGKKGKGSHKWEYKHYDKKGKHHY